jgi:DsbC/DsbD-like thiol-disulfide interchange protein
VCEKICLPARATLALDLPTGVSAPYASALAAARARVPARVAPDQLGMNASAIEAHAWRLCFAADPAGPREAFVEAPSGYWLTEQTEGLSEERECLALTLRDAPAEAAGPIAIRVTLVGPERAVETALMLEAGK